MKTAGQILQQARKRKKISLARAAQETKIQPAYLRALEANNYAALPSLTSARGFIKNYAEFLGLSSEKTLAFFRRDLNQEQVEKFALSKPIKPVGKLEFTWTPKATTIAVGIGIALLFIVYLIWQYFSLASAPYY